MFFPVGKTATFGGKILNFDLKYPILTLLTTIDQLKPHDDTDDYLRNVSESITWLFYSLHKSSRG